jgi:type II secretory pathway pseudopilin PulG
MVELAIAISVISILAFGIYSYVFDAVDDSKRAKVKADIDQYIRALRLYEADYGKEPLFIKKLEGTHITKITKDPWDSDYFVDIKRGAVSSPGPDAQIYTEDDIFIRYEPENLYPVRARLIGSNLKTAGHTYHCPVLEVTFSKNLLSQYTAGSCYSPLSRLVSDFTFYYADEDGNLYPIEHDILMPPMHMTYSNRASETPDALKSRIISELAQGPVLPSTLGLLFTMNVAYNPDSIKYLQHYKLFEDFERTVKYTYFTLDFNENHFSPTMHSVEKKFTVNNFSRVMHIPFSPAWAYMVKDWKNFEIEKMPSNLYINTVPSSYTVYYDVFINFIIDNKIESYPVKKPSSIKTVSSEDGEYSGTIRDMNGTVCRPAPNPVMIEIN